MTARIQSTHLQPLYRKGLVLVCIALMLTLVSAWITQSHLVAHINDAKLQNYQKSLRSYTREGLLLAYQYQHERTLSTYAQVSAGKLFNASSDIADELKTKTPESNV